MFLVVGGPSCISQRPSIMTFYFFTISHQSRLRSIAYAYEFARKRTSSLASGCPATLGQIAMAQPPEKQRTGSMPSEMKKEIEHALEQLGEVHRYKRPHRKGAGPVQASHRKILCTRRQKQFAVMPRIGSITNALTRLVRNRSGPTNGRRIASLPRATDISKNQPKTCLSVA